MSEKALTINQQNILDRWETFVNQVEKEVLELRDALVGLAGELGPVVQGRIDALLGRLEVLKDRILQWDFENIIDFIGAIKEEITLLREDLNWLRTTLEEAGDEVEDEVLELIDDIEFAIDQLWEGILEDIGEPIGGWLEQYKQYFIWAAIAAAVVIGLIIIF